METSQGSLGCHNAIMQGEACYNALQTMFAKYEAKGPLHGPLDSTILRRAV